MLNRICSFIEKLLRWEATRSQKKHAWQDDKEAKNLLSSFLKFTVRLPLFISHIENNAIIGS